MSTELGILGPMVEAVAEFGPTEGLVLLVIDTGSVDADEHIVAEVASMSSIGRNVLGRGLVSTVALRLGELETIEPATFLARVRAAS